MDTLIKLIQKYYESGAIGYSVYIQLLTEVRLNQ